MTVAATGRAEFRDLTWQHSHEVILSPGGCDASSWLHAAVPACVGTRLLHLGELTLDRPCMLFRAGGLLYLQQPPLTQEIRQDRT